MLELKIEYIPAKSKKSLKVYAPLKQDSEKLYGNIDLYKSEKNFASAVCCMCCN